MTFINNSSYKRFITTTKINTLNALDSFDDIVMKEMELKIKKNYLGENLND